MDRITEQLSKLQELSNEELADLETQCISEFETTQESGELSNESVATMTKLADAVEAVRTEKARRVTEAAALEEAAAEAAARVKATEDDKDDEDEPAAEDLPADEAPEVPVEEDDEDEDDVKLDTAFSEKSEPAAEASVSEAAVEAADEHDPGQQPPADEPDTSQEPATAPPDADELPEPAPPAPPAEGPTTTAEAPAPAPPVEAPASEASIQETKNESQEDNVTADAAPQGTGELAIEPPAGREPQIRPATTLSITAGADVPGYSAGAKLSSAMDVADAFQKRLHTLRHVNGGDGEQHIVASYRQEFPSDRMLSANDPLENTDKIQSVTSLEAVTAAAGICLPLETRYDLGCDVGVTDRPVRDALARFGSDRGGIRFFSAPVLTASAAATGFWRSDGSGENWATYGPDRTTATTPAGQKPCLEVQCTTEQEAYIEAITLCLTFNNLTTRTFPELIKRHNELALVAHSRIAENALLAQIEVGSTAVTMPAQVIGAARELFNTLALAVASYRYKHRMNSVTPLRMVVPAWVREFVKADLAMQMPGDGLDDTLGLADAKIDAWFRARGVNITWHLDGVGPAIGDLDGGGAGTAEGFTWPAELEFALFAEGTWLYLDGGTLDLGVIRDSSLVATNQYKQFVETFEGVANIGCDSYWLTAPLRPTGQAAALVDTLG